MYIKNEFFWLYVPIYIDLETIMNFETKTFYKRRKMTSVDWFRPILNLISTL